VAFSKYPALSVVTTSVHDSSTLREWWETEGESASFMRMVKPTKAITEGVYTAKTAEWFLSAAASAKSLFCIYPIQDFLSLSDSYRSPEASEERINVPGTVTDFNWTYRLPVSATALADDTALTERIAVLVQKHERN
jgi:4-alpha-glucanotransferase